MRRIHTKVWPALRDWTTWAAGIVGGALASLSPMLVAPWSGWTQIAAVLVILVGTLLKGPQKKEEGDGGNT